MIALVRQVSPLTLGGILTRPNHPIQIPFLKINNSPPVVTVALPPTTRHLPNTHSGRWGLPRLLAGIIWI